ncbi:MAG: AAA family ATPase [Cypionkella sp.]
MKYAPLQPRPDDLAVLPRQQPVGETPHIRLHAFCETPVVAVSTRRAVSDRRLSRATTDVSMGGIRAAIAYCGANPTPDVLILESAAERPELLAELAELAPVCDARTKVIVIGTSNDIAFYRELIDNGIVEYLLAPVDPLTIISAVLRLFQNEDTTRIGKIHAFIGAKGGVGSSVLAQNLAWTVSQGAIATLLADLDLQFGTAALNYNIDCPIGFADQLSEGDRLDAALVERLLFKHGPHLSILPCATAAHISKDPDVSVIAKMLDLARASFPHVLLDLPSAWSPLVRSALLAADEITLVAEPDLGNLRNARCILDFLKSARPNDQPPRLILNRVGMPKRKEIGPKQFASALGIDLSAKIAFEPALFSAAEANGQMIAEASPRAAVADILEDLASQLSGGPPRHKSRGLARFWRH